MQTFAVTAILASLVAQDGELKIPQAPAFQQNNAAAVVAQPPFQPNPAEREMMDRFKDALTLGQRERIFETKLLNNALHSRTVPRTIYFPDGSSRTFKMQQEVGMPDVRRRLEVVKNMPKGSYMPSFHSPVKDGDLGTIRAYSKVFQVVKGIGVIIAVYWQGPKRDYELVMIKSSDTGSLYDRQSVNLENVLFEAGKPHTYLAAGGFDITIPCLYELSLSLELMKMAREEWLGQAPKPEQPKPDPIRKPRTWNDTTGEFSIVATFSGCVNGRVRLEVDGKKAPLMVPMEKLSDADQKYIMDMSR